MNTAILDANYQINNTPIMDMEAFLFYTDSRQQVLRLHANIPDECALIG
jgi:hypothetical protein